MTTPRTDVRQHILETAKPIILSKAFSAVGLNEVLTAAAVPKGSFYHYFKSKESFGEALLDDYFTGYLAAVDLVLKNTDEPAAQRLLRYWQAWMPKPGDGVQCQCLAAKLGGEVSDLSEAMRLTLRHGTDSIIARLAECMREGIVDGSLPADLDAEHCALTLYQLWFGATLLTKIRRDASALDSAMLATRKMLKL